MYMYNIIKCTEVNSILKYTVKSEVLASMNG